jgi:xylulokinase
VYDLLAPQASSVPIGSEGVVFLPYLNGERSPHLNPRARGVFFGLSSFHNKQHMTRSVFEGISFSLLECFETMERNGLQVNHLTVAVGGARSDFWVQMLADIFNLPMVRTNVTDTGTLGCAILAGLGVGIFTDLDNVVSNHIKIKSIVYPNEINHQTYSSSYQKFRQIYRHILPLF